MSRTTCQPVKCKYPPSIKNGRILKQAFRYKQVLQFECETGYKPKTDYSITCTADGSWDVDDMISCDPVLCKALSAPNHGFVQHLSGTSTTNESIPWKGKAVFSCKEGFQLFGATEASCLSDGTWSNIIPQCQSKFRF